MRHSRLISTTFVTALVCVQFTAIRFASDDWIVRGALPATIGLAPIALWPYRNRLGTWVMFVGLAANLAVILANGGLMPIERRTVEDAIGVERASRYVTGDWIPGSKDVLVEDGHGRGVALGDSIIVRTAWGGFAASPGDVVVWAGVALLAAEAALAWQRQKRVSGDGSTDPPQYAEGGAPSLS